MRNVALDTEFRHDNDEDDCVGVFWLENFPVLLFIVEKPTAKC